MEEVAERAAERVLEKWTRDPKIRAAYCPVDTEQHRRDHAELASIDWEKHRRQHDFVQEFEGGMRAAKSEGIKWTARAGLVVITALIISGITRWVISIKTGVPPSP